MTATQGSGARDVVVAERPAAGTPRPYEFPAVATTRLDNGLSVLVADLPGRPLISATMVLPTGAADEPPGAAGSTVLAARALTEGTDRYDAIALTEASERLGASLHAEAGWDATSIGVDVPASPARPRPRAPRRGPAPPDVPRGRDRAPARRAPQRPPPGAGRSAPTCRRDLHRHHLRVRVALPSAGGGDARIGPWPRSRRGSRRLRACARPRSGDAGRGGRPRRSGRGRHRHRTPRRMAGCLGHRRRPRGRRHPGRHRPAGPRGPPTRQRPDGDPHRPPRAAAPGRGFPRGLGDECDPRRPVQLAPEHAAA